MTISFCISIRSVPIIRMLFKYIRGLYNPPPCWKYRNNPVQNVTELRNTDNIWQIRHFLSFFRDDGAYSFEITNKCFVMLCDGCGTGKTPGSSCIATKIKVPRRHSVSSNITDSHTLTRMMYAYTVHTQPWYVGAAYNIDIIVWNTRYNACKKWVEYVRWVHHTYVVATYS